MTFGRLTFLLFTIAMIAVLAGCGGLVSAPAISVSFTASFQPPSYLNTGDKVSIAATVANDSSNLGVNWTVTCGSAQCGTFNPVSTGSAAATRFTAPSTIPAGSAVTVTATSVADSTKTVSATIAISDMPITISPQPRADMNVNSTAPFTANVANDSQNAGVNWTVTCASAKCGSFLTANPVASGSPATYQAPASIPTGGTVTLTATSVTDNTQAASTNVTITQAATTLGDGTYVFHLSGADFTAANGESNYYVAGAFTVSGGLITGGEQNLEDYNDSLADSINPETSSIRGTADGNLQIVLDTGDSAIGVNGVETLSATAVTGARALIGEYDLVATSTGTLDLQTSQAPPSGGYAFFATGIDHNGGAMAFGGVLNVDGPGSISGTGSVMDFNDSSEGIVLPDQTFASSSVTAAPDSFGRVAFTLNPANGNIGQIVLIGYIVDAATIQVLETADTLGGTTGGMARGQGDKTGAFSNASLSGSTYVAGADGVDSNGNLELAGAFSFSATTNNVSGNATLSDIVNELSGNISGGTYLVDATGRATVAGLSGPTFDNATMQLYLDGNGNAFTLFMDTSDVAAGYGFQQVAGAAFSGLYAATAEGSALMPSGYLAAAHGVSPHPEAMSEVPVPWSAVGQIYVDRGGNVSGFTDFDMLTGPVTPNVQLYGVATGSAETLTGTLTGAGVTSSGADTFTYYVIDDHRAFAIETDATQLNLAYFEQLQQPQ